MRRTLKIAGWTVGALLLLVLLLIGTVFVAGNTSSGRHLIERVTARLTDGRVRLQGLGGSFPSQLDLERLEVGDERGVWLTADHISLRWSPMALLVRHVQVDSLEVARLSVTRRPITHPDDKNTTPSVPRTDVTHLAIHALDLGHELAGSDVSLVVTANAHLRSLQDASANVSAQRTSGLGHYELALKFDPARMDATLKLQEPANGPLENILRVPGLGDLSVLATLSGPRSAEHVQLTLDAGSLRGRAQGTLDLPAKAAELTYSLNAAAMTPAPGLAWNSISLQGNWHGPITTANADGRLNVEALQIPGGVGLGTLAADLKAAGGLLTAHAVLEKVVLPGPKPELLRDSPLTVDATVHMDDAARPVQLTAVHSLFALRADVATAGKQMAKIELRLPDLKPLAALGGQDVRGASTITADLTHDEQSTTLKADANSRIDGGKAAWVGLLRGPTRLQLSARVSEKSFTVDNLALAANTLSLTLNGTASREATQKLNARFALSLSDLRKLAPQLAGNLKLTGKLDGPSDAMSAAADLKATLSVRGSPLSDLSASLNAEDLPQAPRGTIEAHGDLDGSPLRLNASLDQSKPNQSQPSAAKSGAARASSNSLAFHAVIHRADWKSVHADGDFSGSDDFKQSRGQLAFSVKQLSDLNRLLGTTLEGAVDGTASMRPEGRHSRAEFRLNAQDVSTGGVHANAQVAGSGPLDSLNLQLAAQSPAIAGSPASLTAVSVLNMTAHTLRVASADAKLYGQEIHLVAPTTASFGDGFALTATTLKADEAELKVAGRFSPTLDLRAAVKNVQPALINAFVPDLLAAGKIEGDANVKGSFTEPTGQIHLQALGMRSASEVANGLPPVDVHASADLMGNTAVLNAKLGAGSKSQLTLDGHAPLAASGALDLKLAGTLDTSLVNPLLEVRGRHVEGQLAIDTTVTGDTASPKVGGTIRLAKGVFRDYTQGINLTDITAQVEGNEKALRIVNFTARAAPGTLTATGSANILEAGIPLDIKLTAKNAQPITNSIVTANVDADIHLSGKAREQLDINGTVHVNRADVGIPSGFPPNVAVLDVRRPGQTPPPQSEKPLIIRLDIRVQAPRQILVQGRGLDAELGGELRVRGTTDSPRVSGGFDLQRGTFDIASSRLTFSNGAVTFNGAGLKQKLDPTLDFTAQTQVSDATATVRITGFADSPKIELSSTPDLPQDEILARLLFGENAAQLTALQVVQIGSALATLSGGGGGGLNPLAKIQKTLGLDRLSVGGGSSSGPPGTSSTGATIEAGRYVSSRVFVAVKESTTGTSQLAVDVDLTKHLKLQTRLGNGTATAQGTTPENDPGSSVGIAYQFEY